ncbi:MAG: site-specific DNA-methyltransferase [Conexivisphaerales archaeon]
MEKLKVFFEDNIEFKNERYHLNWAGKTDAIRLLQTPTYNTLKPCREESVNFDTTENLFIEGDNLEVLKILQKSYFGKIKMIYIDPPYNTGNDFIYKDDFSETLAEYRKNVGDMDENGNITKAGLFHNTKENGHYHSNWLNMMYPRLFLARSLLSEDGVIFISIDDNEVHNLRLLMDEIFGEENFIACFVRRQNLAGKQDAKKISVEHDYILLYSKYYDKDNINKDKASLDHYIYEDEFVNERGKFYLRRMDDDSISYSDNLNYPITFKKGEIVIFFDNGEFKETKLDSDLVIYPNNDPNNRTFTWRWSESKINSGKINKQIVLKKNRRR